MQDNDYIALYKIIYQRYCKVNKKKNNEKR